MKIRIALILLLCEFCIDIGAIFFGGGTSTNKTSHQGITNPFPDYANKTCRLGIMNPFSDFAELTSYTCFVDKTLLIEEFFKISGPRQYHVITCPSKFGKTTNLDTIKRFLQNDEQNRQLFNGSSQNLKISPSIYSGNGLLRNHFQNQKCIYISFKNIAGKSLQDTINALRQSLSLTYKEFGWEKEVFSERSKHWYLGDQNKKNVELMEKMMNPNQALSEEEVVNGLSQLLSLVAELSSDKNITILIDDYDDPIRNAIEHNLDVTRIHKLIERIFSTLFHKRHPNLRYALITGTLNVLEETQFSHIKHWNFLDNHYFTKYFGLTTFETGHLLSNHSIESKVASRIKQYYGRYYTSDSVTQIHNPYSIIKCLSCTLPNNPHAAFENYWLKSTGRHIPNFMESITKNNENFRQVISQLLASKKIKFKLLKYWNLNDLEELRKITHDKPCQLTARRINLILSYLFHNGYLSHGDEAGTYCVPSEEITTYLNESLIVNKTEDASLDFDAMKAILSPH